MREENIAVHCKTEEEWEEMRAYLSRSGHTRREVPYLASNPCYNLKGIRQPVKIFEEEGYTIIPASEYLKEEEFKVGDRVQCISSKGEKVVSGRTYIVKHYPSKDGPKYVNIEGPYAESFNLSRFRKLTNQPKTTKKEESTMAQIQDNFIEVFSKDTKLAARMSERFGAQYSNDDRDLLALRRDKDELVKILDAEEKKAAKEEKAAKK